MHIQHMRNQRSANGCLSDYIKCIHNQQSTIVDPNLTNMFNLSQLSSLTLNFLTQNLNLTLQDLPSNINSKPYYFQSQFIIPSVVKKAGLISKQLAQMLSFDTEQEKLLAIFQTMKFLQCFPAQNKQKYSSNQAYQPLIIDFLKPLYPRMNVHKDNLPLYMPFYHRINSYQTQVEIGNPNWQLARRMFNITYRREMKVLNDETRQEIALQQQNEGNNAESSKYGWFNLLMCDDSYFKKYQKRSGLESIWAMLHFYYVQQTLKPYRNIHMTAFNDESPNITLESIAEKLKQLTSNEKEQQLTLTYSTILYYLTGDINDFVNFIQLIKSLVQDKLAALTRNQLTKQDEHLTFIVLVNVLCSQLLRNLIEIESSGQMRDQTKINILKTNLKHTINIINNCVDYQLPYLQYYLRIAYPSNLHNKQQARENQQKILSILEQSLNKQVQVSTEIYSFPEYAYFEREFYEQFSQIYLKKYPNKIIQIANYLPPDVVIWRLINSPNLANHIEFKNIRKVLLEHKQKYIKAIQQRVPEITQNNYVNFVQSWDMYHQLFDTETDQNLDQLDQFFKKLQKCKISLNFLYDLELPQVFSQHIYFALDKGENLLKITSHVINGFEEILRQVDSKTQKEIVSQYSQLLNNPKFQTNILTKLTEEQKGQFWKKWTVVYLADESLVKDLVGAESSEEIQDQPQPQIEKDQRIPVQQVSKKPSKKSNEMVVMDLED